MNNQTTPESPSRRLRRLIAASTGSQQRFCDLAQRVTGLRVDRKRINRQCAGGYVDPFVLLSVILLGHQRGLQGRVEQALGAALAGPAAEAPADFSPAAENRLDRFQDILRRIDGTPMMERLDRQLNIMRDEVAGGEDPANESKERSSVHDMEA